MTVKLVDTFVRKEGTSFEEFEDYLRNEHVELVRQLPNLQKCTTSVPKTLDGIDGPLPAGPDEAEYDAIIELYFESVEDLFAAFDSEAGRAVQEDVGEFLETGVAPTFVVDEANHEPEA